MTHVPNIKLTKKPIFLTFNAKKTFNYLRQAFIKTLIFQYFDPKSHIWIKTDISSYTIDRVLSQLDLDSDLLPNNLNKSDFDLWYSIIYFFRKIILTKN